MASENDEILKNLKGLDGRLGRAICRLGCGGDGNVSLHEMEKDGVAVKVAVKSVARIDAVWNQ